MGRAKIKRESVISKTMIRRSWVLLILAAGAGPAMAETQSRDCLAAIKAANDSHRADKVPGDCWRMGPLHIGMRADQAKLLLGTPDTSQSFTAVYRRRKYDITQILYVYPRNLRNWLRLAPSRQEDFHPITVRLSFVKDALVALTVRNDVRVTAPTCQPSIAGRYFERKAVDFPYGFHGLTLGTQMAQVEARFGRFTGHTNAYFYWPLPLAVGGSGSVSSIDIASGMAFVNRGGPPDFRLDLDARGCRITGYSVQLAPRLPARPALPGQ